MTFAKNLMAGMALAALAGGVAEPQPRRALAYRGWRDRVSKLLLTNQKRTPKPEQMFQSMLKDGSAILIRRRGKPPLLKQVKRQQDKE